MRIVVFEDNQCHRLYPMGLFRPAHELTVGACKLNDLITRLGEDPTTVVRGQFQENDQTETPFPAGDGPVLFLNASIEPDIAYLEKFRSIIDAGDPFLTTSGNRVAAALVPPDRTFPQTLDTASMRPLLLEMNLPLEDELFNTIDWPHEAVDAHVRLFARNLDAIIAGGEFTEREPGVYIGKDVTISPSVVIDAEHGPVVIDSGATIRHFAYIEGPVYIGPHTKINEHAQIKDNTAIGSHCKVGGEVEASSIGSYSNKQHHGFLGHSWMGRWVNLGAGTSTSDLKNTYGTVNVEYNGQRVSTGMQFLGAIIGDYAKSAVNTTLYTGKVVGVCSMLYGTVTTNVPSFSNYARSFGQVTEVRLDQILKTQERMFSRRGVAQAPVDVNLMNRVFELTRHERTMSEEQITF